MRASGGRTVLWAVTILAAEMVSAGAQDRPFRESVSIPVDAEVAKSLRMVRDQWGTAPDAATLSALVELCDAHGDQLVLQDRGVAGGAARFVRLQAIADELVAALPPELRAAYRQRIDPLAEPWWKAWQSTGDVRYLDRLVTRGFYSSWGDDAVDAAGQWAWDRGDFTAAKRHWQRLLSTKANGLPNTSDGDAVLTPAAISARLILCDLGSRHWSAVEESLKTFEELYPSEQGTLAGRTDRWTVLLKAELTQAKEWQPQLTPEDVTTYGGDFTRQHIAPQSLDIGGELWSVSLPNPRLPTGSRMGVFPATLPLAFHPAVWDDLVLVNDGRQIHAWNLYSGKAYWDAGRDDGDVIYPVVSDPSPMMPARPVVGQSQWTVTVAQGRVYARMGSAVTTPAATEFRDLPDELVCLDISQGEGQLLWKLSADDLAPAAGELPGWRWEGSPVVESGRVYAVLSRRRPQLEWSIACLDAESGLMLWQRSIGITRPTPPDHENRVTSLLLTAGGGQLFLSTGWGAVVALEPRDGTVNWATTYESTAVTNGFVSTVPLLFAEGRIYAALLDGDRLACLDAATGRFVWSRPLTESYKEILGIAHNRLIVSGRSLWGFDADKGELAWSVPASDPEDWGYGRGALAGDQILWTTHNALWFIEQRTGALLREHPLSEIDIDVPRSGGNVLVSHGVILIAGADRLTAYGEFARLREALQQPLSHLRQELRRELKLAEIAWTTGATAQAEQLWDRVQQRAEPATSFENQRARQRVGLLPGRRSPRPMARSQNVVPVMPVAVKVNTPMSLTPRTVPAGYWRRVAQKPLSDGARALLPNRGAGDPPLGVLVDASPLVLWDPVAVQEQTLAQANQSVEWWGQWADRFVVVTEDEILVFDRRNQALIQRRPRPSLSTRSSVEWVIHSQGLLMLAPPRELALLDVVTGDWRWQRTAEAGGWHRLLGWNAERLALHPSGFGGTEIWDMATGLTRRREHPPTGPWKLAPVFTGRDDDYLTVTEDDRLVGKSAVGARRWEYVGVVPQAHVAPWVFLDGDDVLAVLDGTRLVRITQSSGWPRWSTVIADVPLRSPSQQMAMADRRLLVASAGVLRCVDLETGTVAWKTTFPTIDAIDVRCVCFADKTFAVLPMATPASTNASLPVSSVILYSTATGRPLQSLKLPALTARLELAALDPTRTVLLTDRNVLVYQR